jgi:hypothetical protein
MRQRLKPVVQKSAEMEAQQEDGREEFEFGVKLYERGRYPDSERMLTTALDVAGSSLFFLAAWRLPW